MIRKFSVENYKGFKDKIIFDFTTNHDYKFHPEAVANGISKKNLVFGKNGTGKSNLGCALMDIVIHLTDKNRNAFGPYKNLDNNINVPASFSYEFLINGHIINYDYKKNNYLSLLEERLKIDGVEVAFVDYLLKTKQCDLKETQGVDLDQFNYGLSFIKFLHSRIDYTLDCVFNDFYNFVENMLSFKSLKENQFDGYLQGGAFFADIISENGGDSCLKELEKFIFEKTGVKYSLFIGFDSSQNHKEIFANFENGSVPLGAVWSTGTSSLVLFFCWQLVLNSVSFLYLDEFDAFYHYELSEEILRIVNFNDHFQSVVTTHNCGLMTNKLTRPDCCYILSNNKIEKLVDCTDRELREGHNLENLYKNGAFTE